MTVVTLPNSQALPEIPRYKPSYQNKSTAFLVTNDWIFVSALMWLDDAAHVTEASQGKRQLFIFSGISITLTCLNKGIEGDLRAVTITLPSKARQTSCT
jgi:hypothetical protein